MKKHKKLLIVIIIFAVIILANVAYYVISNLQGYFLHKSAGAASQINLSTYSNPKIGFSVKYPETWVVNDQGDTVLINPPSKSGNVYFSVAKRSDFTSLDDVKRTLSSTVATTPIQIDTGTGFEYADTDFDESIWLVHSNAIYIIRVYSMSQEAKQILSSFKFEN